MSKYHTITHSIMVKPVSEPIYSEQGTIIALEDEAGGVYLIVRQEGKIREPGVNQVEITAEEWPHIRGAIDQMLEVVKKLNHIE